MKERLLPKKTLPILVLATSLALGALAYERSQNQGQWHVLHRDQLLVNTFPDYFRVIDSDAVYEFEGTFHYEDKERDYLAIGVTQSDNCAVVIFRPDKEPIVIRDNGTNPYRIINVNDQYVRYYSEKDYQITEKDFWYHEDITMEVYSYSYPPYGGYYEPPVKDCS